MSGAKEYSLPKSRRWTVSEARGVVGALERSGLPVTRFAAQHGLGVERLYLWRRRLQRAKPESSRPPRFAEVRLAVPALAAIELVLPGGMALRFAGASRLEDAVAVLTRLTAR